MTFLFFTRIFDLALFRSSDLIRIGVSLAAGILVTGLVIAYSKRVVRIVPAQGGFLVSPTIAERMLELIHPEAGKFLVVGTPTRIEPRVPLSLHGDPEQVMMSVHSHFGAVPLDNVPWVFLKID